MTLDRAPQSSSPPVAPSRLVKEGEGWRLGWDPAAPVFQGLVGGSDWAFELTAAEWADFCRLVQELATTMAEMEGLVMAEEQLTLEAASDRLGLEAEGFAHAYDLTLIVHQGRGAEGHWYPGAVAELVRAVQGLQVFC